MGVVSLQAHARLKEGCERLCPCAVEVTDPDQVSEGWIAVLDQSVFSESTSSPLSVCNRLGAIKLC